MSKNKVTFLSAGFFQPIRMIGWIKAALLKRPNFLGACKQANSQGTD